MLNDSNPQNLTQADIQELFENAFTVVGQLEEDGDAVEADRYRMRVARQFAVIQSQTSGGMKRAAADMQKRWAARQLSQVNPENLDAATEGAEVQGQQDTKANEESFIGEIAEPRAPSKSLDDLVGDDYLRTLLEVLDDLELIDEFDGRETPLTDDWQNKMNVCLHGPAGTAKSMGAEAIASALADRVDDVVFIPVSGGHFKTSEYGESAARMRRLLEEADELDATPIIFIDEFEEVASRDGHEASASIVQTLLGKTEGPPSVDDVVIIAATNRPDMIDEAIKDRFRMEEVTMPEPQAQWQLLHQKLCGFEMFGLQELQAVDNRLLAGVSGRDLQRVAEHAFRRAARRRTDPEADPRIELADVRVALKAFHEAGDADINHHESSSSSELESARRPQTDGGQLPPAS